MLGIPEPRREKEDGGMSGNETHRQKIKREAGGENSNSKKPYYNLNNTTHDTQPSLTSIKVVLDNEVPER